ncbi:MAG: ribose 5-phosphate isomerase B [Clostridia bacterium]|nr:ribose 5-phosphate isomerase B [Clostridia bacterium]
MLAIGSDHAGYELKEKLKKYFEENGIKFNDFGTFNSQSCDYPIIAEKVGKSVLNKESEKGILICGAGIGMSIAANKIKSVRAALCYEPELAGLARKHNNANVLCMGGRFTDFEKAKEIVKVFLNTDFEGERHQKRIDLITKLESN